jgi:hypothetical protein
VTTPASAATSTASISATSPTAVSAVRISNDETRGQSLYPIEQWRPIEGFTYEVSSLGRVRNAAGRVLRPGRCKSGHQSVVLGRSGGSRYVHRLVAHAFIGPCPEGLEVRHLDDDPSCNEWSNIIYGTRTENSQDKKWNKGQSNFKLSVDEVREVKRLIAIGVSGVSISRKFGICRSQVSNIKYGRSHADIPNLPS